MRDELKSYLHDILQAISRIDTFLKGISTFEQYQNNQMLKSAIERQIEIIGEAINNLLKQDPSISISNSRTIVNMRNKLIHGYDEVDDTIVWNTVKKYIPLLKSEIEELL